MIQVTIEVLADRSAVMDTTNAIESLNRGRTVFPNAMGLTKALYLATWELTKKMDYARSKLGAGLRGTGHSVSRQAERRRESEPSSFACRSPILAFPRQPAKAKPLARWLR